MSEREAQEGTRGGDGFRRRDAVDGVLGGLGRALATVFAAPSAHRPRPRPSADAGAMLSPKERRRAGALMRVNHVGEVCAQALYDGQAATTSDAALRSFFRKAAAEEADHLAWTRARLDELASSPSLLNPLWYAGAFAMGAVAGRVGNQFSLAFMIETERQVEEHLAGHLERLPAQDIVSRAIVEQMKADEAGHAAAAREQGGTAMPLPVRLAMRGAARVMTLTAHYI